MRPVETVTPLDVSPLHPPYPLILSTLPVHPIHPTRSSYPPYPLILSTLSTHPISFSSSFNILTLTIFLFHIRINTIAQSRR